VEKHQLKAGLGILHLDPVGAAARDGRAVAADQHLDRGHAGQRHIADRGRARAVHPAHRQRQDQILGRIDPQSLVMLCRFWTNPFERFQPRKKRPKIIGSLIWDASLSHRPAHPCR
jgi:hypothetical protein